MNLSIPRTELELEGFDAGGGEIYNYLGKRFTGTLLEYYNNGAIDSEEEFVDGHKNDVQRVYYENGQMKRESHWRFNHFYNSTKRWDSNGKLLCHIEYDDDGNFLRYVVKWKEQEEL